jgi:hypothetical protein
MTRIRSLLALITVAILVPACGWFAVAGVIVGVDHAVNKKNDNGSWRDFEATPEQTFQAVQNELRENWPDVVVKNKPALKDGVAKFEGRKGHINIAPHVRYKQYTRIDVKTGTFDSKERSDNYKKFLDSIGKRLGE